MIYLILHVISGPKNITKPQPPRFRTIKIFGGVRCVCGRKFVVGYIAQFLEQSDEYNELSNICAFCTYKIPRASITEQLLVCGNKAVHGKVLCFCKQCIAPTQMEKEVQGKLAKHAKEQKENAQKRFKHVLKNGPNTICEKFNYKIDVCNYSIKVFAL